MSILSLALVVLLGLALVGCSKPAPPPTTEVQPGATPPPAAPPGETATAPAEPGTPAGEAAKPAAEGDKAKTEAPGPKLEGEEGKPVQKTKSGLEYVVLEKGTGPQPKKGDKIVAEYTGWLTDGKEFDTSKGKGNGFEFTVGVGEVIPAWDQALLNMKVGERRKLIVPPELGYGPSGMPPVIPPDATLIFEVKLLKIK